MNGALRGEVALVTGADREIGAAMAIALAEAGAAVVLAHHDAAEAAEATAERIRRAGGRAATEAADLSRPAENRALVARVAARFGRLDVFVANAGITAWAPFLETDEAAWDAVTGLNLKGAFFGAQAAAAQMIAQGAGAGMSAGGAGRGRIVFSSSVAGVAALRNCAPYAVTKAGLRHLARVLALELGPHGITVNALGIGATLNARNLGDDPDYEARWSAAIPAGRCGRPEDVAAALMFLVSPGAAMVSGHTLMLDGGWAGVGAVPR